MELQEFLKMTLVQISKGIEDAKMELGDKTESKTIINPKLFSSDKTQEKNNDLKKVQEVEFDIALVVEQKSEGKAGIGVLASIITAGASTSSGKNNSETHRIKFSVPIKFA